MGTIMDWTRVNTVNFSVTKICSLEIFVGGQNQQSGHKPEKKQGKLRELEKLSESQGKLGEISIFEEKPGKLRENVRYVA